jgi:hypothetical protein
MARLLSSQEENACKKASMGPSKTMLIDVVLDQVWKLHEKMRSERQGKH